MDDEPLFAIGHRLPGESPTTEPAAISATGSQAMVTSVLLPTTVLIAPAATAAHKDRGRL